MTPSSPRRILVVDDEANLRKLVGSYLRAEGWEVVEASDGASGVDMVRRRNPDLVVLDVRMPGLEGVEALRQIRTFSDVYVIMLPARAEESDKLIGLSVGADDYLTKPFSPRELVARIKAVLRRDHRPRAANGHRGWHANHADRVGVRSSGRSRISAWESVLPKSAARGGVGMGLLRR
jgi:DNA-binding response OmpR family regulator